MFTNNVRTDYTYRPDGLRHCKEIGGVLTTHLWDGQNMAAEVGANGVFARYIRGVNLIARRQDNLNQYYHFNAHGDVVLRTDYNGTALKHYDYDAFGVEKNPEILDVSPWRFCGEYWDRETQSYYIRARYYNPANGRWLSEDSARSELNWYTYCDNSPISYSDPSGNIPWPNLISGGIGAVIGAVAGGISAHINNENVLAGAIGGAVAGFVTGFTGSFLGGLIAGGVNAFAQGAINNNLDAGNVIGTAITTGVFGKIGGIISDKLIAPAFSVTSGAIGKTAWGVAEYTVQTILQGFQVPIGLGINYGVGSIGSAFSNISIPSFGISYTSSFYSPTYTPQIYTPTYTSPVYTPPSYTPPVYTGPTWVNGYWVNVPGYYNYVPGGMVWVPGGNVWVPLSYEYNFATGQRELVGGYYQYVPGSYQWVNGYSEWVPGYSYYVPGYWKY